MLGQVSGEHGQHGGLFSSVSHTGRPEEILKEQLWFRSISRMKPIQLYFAFLRKFEDLFSVCCSKVLAEKLICYEFMTNLVK